MIRVYCPVPSPIVLRRMLPDGMNWGNCQFFFEDDGKPYDWLFIFGRFVAPEINLRCQAQNTLLLMIEPPHAVPYPQHYLDNFGTVLASYDGCAHPNAHIQVACPPIVGLKIAGWDRYTTDHDDAATTFDALKSLAFHEKTKLLSVVCSNKQLNPEYKQRVKFVEALREAFQDDIDVFGFGTNPIEDKQHTLCQYYYNICLENGRSAHWWSERLSDAMVCMSMPFYYGCENIHKHFPGNSVVPIDIHHIIESIAAIKESIAQNAYQTHINDLRYARDLTLYHHNPMRAVSDIITRFHGHAPLPPKGALSKIQNYRTETFELDMNKLFRKESGHIVIR